MSVRLTVASPYLGKERRARGVVDRSYEGSALRKEANGMLALVIRRTSGIGIWYLTSAGNRRSLLLFVCPKLHLGESSAYFLAAM